VATFHAKNAARSQYIGWVKKQAVDFLSEYVNKTEKIGGMSTNKNSYRENEVLTDIFT